MTTEIQNSKPSNAKVFFTALRPFAYTASATPVFLGIALVYYAGIQINWISAVVTLIGVMSFHSAANLLNDCFDFKRGLDTAVLPMSGAVVRGWLSESAIFRMALTFLAVGVACGGYLIFQAGWIILLLGVAGSLLVVSYTKDGFCLKYSGLGDIAIFIAFGILPVFGTWWVQTSTFSWLPILVSFPIVSYTVGILHANNWHDIESDPKKNCNTFASRIGEKASSNYYRFLMLAPFVFISILININFIPNINFTIPISSLVVFIALPGALKVIKINRGSDSQKFAMLDGLTAQVQLQFGLLITIGFIIARYVHF